ncbi:MAG: DUF4345 domain-containing protein [Micromonosporaceae bacterium]
MANVLIGAVALFFLGMGVYGLAAPAALIGPFGITLDSPAARTEVRAVYGGFGVAIAALLGYAILASAVRQGAVVAVALALLGMAFGRLVGRAFDRPERFYPTWFYFWVELLGATLLLLALRL